MPPQKRQLIENPSTNDVIVTSEPIQERLPEKKIEKLISEVKSHENHYVKQPKNLFNR